MMKFRVAIGIFFIAVIIIAALQVAYYFRDRQRRYQEVQQAKAEDIKITAIEGWTVKDIAAMLRQKAGIPEQDFIKATQNGDAAMYPFFNSKPKQASLEGFLFPDTYLVPKNPTAEVVIEKMLDNFGLKLEQVGAKADAGGAYMIPGYGMYSLYQVLTLASIIEKETGRNIAVLNAGQRAGLDDERKIIAGIFYNRLAKGMGLESDATINYITGKSDPAAASADLEINSPYNTYKYRGLPPGPISNPSLSSLQAAFFPTKTDYYYFLHKQPSGEVLYSKTFEEHRDKKFKFLSQ